MTRSLACGLLAWLLLACSTAIPYVERPDPLARAGARTSEEQREDRRFAYTSPGELPSLIAMGLERLPAPVPLRHTWVDARVLGHVAYVSVRQEFSNDRDHLVELVYNFPLPENAAVDSLRITFGERVTGFESGRSPALDVFTHSVPSVPPGATVYVDIAYLQTLSQDAGTYEFVFPLVVGPHSTTAEENPITPPIHGEGERAGHDVSLTLDVNAGSSITKWESPMQTLDAEPTLDGFTAELADAPTIPNRDFVVRWTTAESSARARLLLGRRNTNGSGSFALLIQPPVLDLDALLGRREMTFVVHRLDEGETAPLAPTKQALRAAIAGLRPVDTFNVLGWGGEHARLFDVARPANEANWLLASRFLDTMPVARGLRSTEVEAALAPAPSEGGNRYVLWFTEGSFAYASIFPAIRGLVAHAGHARVFGIGLGSSPDREFIAGLAQAGRTVPLYIDVDRKPWREAFERWSSVVDHPVLEDLAIDWGGLSIADLQPLELPDLYASHPIIVLGSYSSESGEIPDHIELSAVFAHDGRRTTIPVAVREVDDRIPDRLVGRNDRRLPIMHGILGSLWFHDQVARRSTRSTYVGPAYHVDGTGHGGGEPFVADPCHWSQGEYGCDQEVLETSARFSNVRASEGVDVPALRTSITSRSREFVACYEQRIGRPGDHRLDLRMYFDRQRRVELLEILDETREGAAANACIDAVLYDLDWRGLPAERSMIEFELHLQMRRR